MNSLEIQYFLTIVKYGSFTEAAQALSVSQPAISKQIRQLEAELGCSLFTRSGRTLSLTEAGQAYHAYFQQCRFQLDLLTVLIRTGLEEYIVSLLSFEAGDTVCQYNLVGITDVGFAGCVGNRRCHIKFFFCHKYLSFSMVFYKNGRWHTIKKPPFLQRTEVTVLPP